MSATSARVVTGIAIPRGRGARVLLVAESLRSSWLFFEKRTFSAATKKKKHEWIRK
jgi:hypothetical protein